jgi:translation initiation factor IF-1
VTRDGRATLKLAAGAAMTGQLVIQVTNETFSIKLLRGDKVRYEVAEVNQNRGTVEIKLMFANPSNISNKMVS